jgi:hypothetical protein
MQKINFSQRVPISANKPFIPIQAGCHVLLAEPGALYAKRGKERVLIGYGTEFRFRLDEPCELVATKDGVEVCAPGRVVENAEEVFTNFDKRPTPSPLEQAVTLALRRMKRAEVEHRRALDADRAKASVPPGASAQTPEPSAVSPEGDGAAEPSVPAGDAGEGEAQPAD